MDLDSIRNVLPDDYVITPGMRTAAKLFGAIFEEEDTILFRPMESWTGPVKKENRVAYDEVCHRQAQALPICTAIGHLEQVADEKRLNVYFGVCPRFGGNGEFDLAWQIRTVRVLWADLDHISVQDARQRITHSRLPQPTAIVNSGNGVHLYWRLDAPYLIDDVGDPPPVLKEWIKTPGGKDKPRPYIMEDGERVYLDEQKHISRLSAKADHVQNLLAGIAQKLGGDHTNDLPRILRVPGTFNRKDQRNGREPVPTELVECDPNRRYPLSMFEGFATKSADSIRAQKIAAMPLPAVRRPSPSTSDKLTKALARCSCAPTGQRSQADFALCCLAIRKGIAKEEVWAQVATVGKFADRGRSYFDLTWEKAEYEARCTVYEEAEQEFAKSQPQKAASQSTGPSGDCSAQSFDSEYIERPIIDVVPATMQIGEILHQATDVLLGSKTAFTRADQLVVVNNSNISAVLCSNKLKGLLSEHVEFRFHENDKSEFRPFPPDYGNTWLNNQVERARLPAIKLFTNNPVYAPDWRLVVPGYDAGSGIYYAGPAVEVRSGTAHLDTYLKDFCFKSPADRSNYVGILLTAILMPHFIGSKPAVIFNGNQPGLGKSILAQGIAILRDGNSVETATYNPNDEEFEKRIGGIVLSGRTTVIIDNAKCRGRHPRIESACLERSITDPVLSFRLLGQSASIRAENSHIFCITANSPDISRDLVTRSVAISLYHEGDPGRRSFSIADTETYAQEYRSELLGELMGMVALWIENGKPLANIQSRFNKRNWGNIIGGILHANGEPDFLANAEEAAAEFDDTRREFTELVTILIEHPERNWTPTELVDECRKHGVLTSELGEGSLQSQATRIGKLAGRFVTESFTLTDGRIVTFLSGPGRKGKVYHVKALA